MLKKALLAVLFTCLIVWVPAAYSGGPSASLSLQVVPIQSSGAGCGVTAGTDAANDVAAAGFNTCALFSDFTASTGSGWTPSFFGSVSTLGNWLDCNFDGGTSSIWYWGIAFYQNASDNLPCSGHVAQVTDSGGGGNLALQITLNYSEMVNGDAGKNIAAMETANVNRNNPVPGPGEYPSAYFEVTLRADNNSSVLDYAFWSWATAQQQSMAGGGLIELDFLETAGTGHCDSAVTRWIGGTFLGFQNPYGGGCSLMQYHTFGGLYTSDGNANYSLCTYVDGARQGCKALAFDTANENLQHHYLIMQNGPGCSAVADTSCVPNFGTANVYIKDFKVLTCSNWLVGMCAGTTFNGNFYQ